VLVGIARLQARGIGSIRRPTAADEIAGGNGGAVYASVRKYGVDADRVDELMHRVDEGFAPRLEQMPGFVAYHMIDAGPDRAGEGLVFTITVCSDREAADRSAEIAAEFVRDELSDMQVERLEAATGAVSVSRAVSEVLEAGHA
jgi:hypothetical protein